MNTDVLTAWLLWALAILGGWNLISMVARICYGSAWARYLWSVMLGAWAAIILWAR